MVLSSATPLHTISPAMACQTAAPPIHSVLQIDKVALEKLRR
jgi:hypothetical protein